MSFTSIATDLISHSGYGGLGLGLVLDSFGIPIPSEVLIPLATILAQQGKFNLVVVFIIAVVAQVIGGIVSYEIGRRGGRPAVERFGRYVLISKRDLDKTHEVFNRYGRWMTAAGRCLPVIRGLVGYPAGIAEMPRLEFLLWTALGSALWTGILMGAGLLLSKHLEVIDQFMSKFSIAIVIVLLGLVIFHFRHVIAERRVGRSPRG